MDRAPLDERTVRFARGFALAFLTAIAGLVVVVMLARFRYPYELEWMTGSMLDHVERVRRGEPLYVAPSGDWIPFIYTPGYYWAAALASRFAPMVQACRAVSVASTAVGGACTWLLARRAGANRWLAAAAPLLFLGCFGYTCQWYDVERADSLLIAMLAVAAVIAQRGSVAAWGAAGALVGAAFFVKQPALSFAVAVPVLVAIGGRRKEALAFAVGAVVAFAPLYVVLQAKTDGWFAYYCLHVPGQHGMALKYVTTFFVSDLSKALVLAIATLGAAAAVFRAMRDPQAIDDRALVLYAFTLAGFAASASSRLHVGGWANVLLFWTTFAVPAACALATELEGALPLAGRVALPLAFALQAGAFAPDPNESVPDEQARTRDGAFEERIRAIEASTTGDVVVLGRGHVTRKMHPHINALVDVLRAGGALPADIAEALRGRSWGALVVNDLNDLQMPKLLGFESPLFELVVRNYFVAERLDDREPMPVVGFPTLPRWVLRPRHTPLVGASHDALERRMTIESGLAERNERAAQADPTLRTDGLSIEDEAARAAAP
jgi:hypothetical protein